MVSLTSCLRSDLVPYSFSISYTVMHFVHAGVQINPVEKASQTITLLWRHMSRGDLLSLAFGHYPLPWLFRLRLLLPSTTNTSNTTLLISKKQKQERYLAYNPSYGGIERWLFYFLLCSLLAWSNKALYSVTLSLQSRHISDGELL
jgi:hypothetical protein